MGEKYTSNLDYITFMRGMCSAPTDRTKCEKCGGIGLKSIDCCDGYMCGCHGMPVDFEVCECGSEKPTDEQIKKWSQNWRTGNIDES